jgi:hypothetical protein
MHPSWKRHSTLALTLLLTAFVGVPGFAADTEAPKWTFELEAGPVWQSRNDVQIPNDDTGTRFSLVDLVGNGPWLGPRLIVNWNIRGRHGLQLYLAPLSYTETGRFEQPVRFAGETFAADTPTDATYQFNSWRASYRYQILRGSRWLTWVGFTAKIRDAKIELQQGGTTARDTDTGFVPLFLFEADYRFADRWHFLTDLDALAGGPGRAIDLALKLGYDLSERWQLTGGYRMIEGGADVDEVYNFAWFHSAVLSVVYRL